MSEITISVSGQNYTLACRDGEEERLIWLASYVDSKASTLIDNLGKVGETHLLLMASLLIADELQDCREGVDGEGSEQLTVSQDRLIQMIDQTSEVIEGIAAKLESA